MQRFRFGPGFQTGTTTLTGRVGDALTGCGSGR